MTRLITATLLAGATLSLAACAATTPRGSSVNPAHPGVALTGTLDGKAEVPGPGDPDGTGEFAGFFDVPGGMMCYDLGVGSLAGVTAAHIHAGAPRVAGPPVITIPVQAGTEHFEGCLPVAKEVLTAIVANPMNYYVNVHTTAHPQGAIRSQLQRP